MTVTISRITPPEFSMITPLLVDIYLAAMRYSRSLREERIEAWRRDTTHQGFTAFVALAEGRVVGLAYGFISQREMWWDKQIRQGLARAGRVTPETEAIVSNYFELAEIHVDPQMQGENIGAQLLSTLLDHAPCPYVVLSTPEVPNEDNRAFRLYRRFGFVDLLRNFRFKGDLRPFAVLVAPTATPPNVEQVQATP